MTVVRDSGNLRVGSIFMDFNAYDGYVVIEIEDMSLEKIDVSFNPDEWREFLLLINSLSIPEETS